MSQNRQLRTFVFILYPDNPGHVNAISILENDDNFLGIKHVGVDDLVNDDSHKEHWHGIVWFDNPFWLSALINHLKLSDDDYHLFHSVRDFKRFKSIDDYIVYLTHINEDLKEDKYTINDFFGSRVWYAKKVFNNIETSKPEALLNLSIFIREYNVENIMDTRLWSMHDWFKLACDNGYGDIFYKEWFKIRDILKAYINY